MTTRGIDMSMVETSVDSKLIEFSKSDAAIALMAEKFLPLTLANPTDAKGFGVIHEARMLVKTKRVEIEKKRVELKADALAFGRQVDSEAKRLTALVEPIESHLADQEKIFTDERDREKREAEAKRQLELQKRIDDLDAIGAMINPAIIVAMTEAEYANFFQAESARLKAAKDAAEAKRKADQDAVVAEAERQLLARIELDAQRAAQQAEQAKLKAESDRLAEAQRKIDAEKLEQQRLAQLEIEKRAAAEQAERLAKERIAATAERERLETISRQHAEAMQPDSVKILKLADAVEALAAIQLSVAVSAKHKTKLASILRRSASEIRDVANSVKVVGNE